jgi:hypothetical protein
MKFSSEPGYWIGVVSREHVRRGVAGGFAQIGHGKAAPLRRMAVGDWLIYYSPVETLAEAVPCRRFTAIGRVRGASVYQVDMGGGFMPFRRDVDYRPATEAPVAPLIEALDFITDKRRWGFPFRRGCLAIGAADFARIAAAMRVEPA